MFKQIIFLVSVLITLSACVKKAKPSFTISGTLNPAKAEYVILKKEMDIERKIEEVIDTLSIDTQGNFKISFTNEPYLYSLNFPNKQKLDIALDSNQHLKLTILGYDSDTFKALAQGSKDTEELLAYEAYRKASLKRLVTSVRKEISELKAAAVPDQKKIDSLGVVEVVNYGRHLDELTDYIQKNMTSTLGLYATSIRWKGANQLTTFDDLTIKFEAKHPDLNITKKIREKVSRLQQTSIGGTVAAIEMPNIAGDLVSLSSITSDYVLIDFWASWCPPCRREAPQLNELMSIYTRKQFDIYSISLDDDRENWLNAIEKDNRNWTNVSKLQRFKTPAAYNYVVTSLPANFLIDKYGKIIAKDLHGEELAIILHTLFTN